MNAIPVIPESAPFTPEQRAYLNGFLAGLFSRTQSTPIPAAPVAKPLEPLTILFGSQTGNCEKLAKRVAKTAGNHDFAPTIHDLAKYPTTQLASEQTLVIVTSTYGDGDPPDNAKSFWEFLAGDAAPKLSSLRFSVCALGDTNYAKFCAFGKAIDARLEQLGATRAHARADCDVDYEASFAQWLSAAMIALAGAAAPHAGSAHAQTTEPQKPTGYCKENPFPARLITNRCLNGPGSGKDVRHFEISFDGAGLRYEVGDALGVLPQNDPCLVNELVAALRARGGEPVPGRNSETVPLRDALRMHYEITRIPKQLLEAFATCTGDELLQKVTSPSANGELTKFLWGREIIDLMLSHPSVTFTPAEFVALLRKLQPRLYSISSSPKAHPGEVHLTVSAVRYQSLGRKRGGVCSTFLADRAGSDTAVPVFVHSNEAFRPPGSDVPLIMVGPGTGIAPFRAFLEERRALGATGKNWLFFGDQKSTTDFLYREELEMFQKEGTRLDLAWSRDQDEKVYVQHRMLENACELYAWLEAGAAFYVCGDASRMAKDVDVALHSVVQQAGHKSKDQAEEFIRQLKAQKRYQRDVY
jgi:sulfite reductase (NADPH) flavoprotein alpha-component